jgi:hypothetical protein
MIAAPRARLAHSVPGRLRVRLDRRETDPEALEPLLARLRRRRGVRSARFNPVSGSVVVEYDPAALTETALLGDLPAVEAPGPAVAPPGPGPRISAARSSQPARALTRCWWETDAALARASGGWIDLKLLVPLALALLAVRQLLRRGQLQDLSWHGLLWYSYNLFYHFHPELRNPPVQPE